MGVATTHATNRKAAAMKADYINPHEGQWHQNDFQPGEDYVTDDRVFTCLTSGVNATGDVELTVKWRDWPGADDRVWPNMQWVALNWTEDDDE